MFRERLLNHSASGGCILDCSLNPHAFDSDPVDSITHGCSFLGGKNCGRIQPAAKMNFGRRDFRSGRRCVSRIRDLTCPHMMLMVDINMASDPETPTPAVRALLDFDVRRFRESPEAAGRDGHPCIPEHRAVPIAPDETIHGVAELRHLMDASRVFLPRSATLTLVGISPWLQLTRRTCGLPVVRVWILGVETRLLSAVHNSGFLRAECLNLDRHLTEMLNPRWATQFLARVSGQAPTARISRSPETRDSCHSIRCDQRPTRKVTTGC